MNSTEQECIQLVWEYYSDHKRPMPWRDNPDPYWVLVSEIMLQQTQVKRVMIKFPEFIETFPDFASLSQASLSEVLQVWQGMGYNRRAKYLWQIAQLIEQEYQGVLPRDPEILATFPGIGKATAGSIIAFAYNIPTVFIETNIRRVFIHHFFHDKDEVSDAEIMPLVNSTVSSDNPREWYYALMDYGTYLKTQVMNPNRKSKHYTVQGAFEGSNRQVRAHILRLLLQRPYSLDELIDVIQDERVMMNLKNLIKEEMIEMRGNQYHIR